MKLALQNYLCHRITIGVRQAEPEMESSPAMRQFQSASAQEQTGFSTQRVPHLGVMPANTFPPSGSNRFEGGFLGGKTSRIVLVLVGSFLAILDFKRRKGAIAQAVSSPHHRQAKLLNLDDVNANSNNHRVFSSRWKTDW
jgi:hypothetical protein